jgi:hypothetical protein
MPNIFNWLVLAEPEGFEPIGPGFAGAVLARGDAQSAPPRAKNRGFDWIGP